MAQLMNTNGWDFVKRYRGWIFPARLCLGERRGAHDQLGAGWPEHQQRNSAFNGKFWLEDGWSAQTNNMNYGHTSASGHNGDSRTC